MKRPIKTIVRYTLNGITILGSTLIISILTGFIATPGYRASLEVPTSLGGEVVNIDGLLKKVLELNQNERHGEAIELLMAALDGKKEDSLLRALLLQTFDMFLENEIREGQRLVRANRNDVDAYARVAGALELMTDEFRAMEVLLNGISFNPNSSKLWMKIGKLELKANRNMEALDVFKEVIKLDPKNSDAYNNAAFILSQAQDCSENDLRTAENFASNARNLDPQNPEYIDTLAEVHFRKGNEDLAQSLIKEAIRLAPSEGMFKTKLRKFSRKNGLRQR